MRIKIGIRWVRRVHQIRQIRRIRQIRWTRRIRWIRCIPRIRVHIRQICVLNIAIAQVWCTSNSEFIKYLTFNIIQVKLLYCYRFNISKVMRQNFIQ